MLSLTLFMQCNPFIYTRSGTEILSRKHLVILRPTKTTTQKEGEGVNVELCREQDQLHPTPITGLLCCRGTADGAPTSRLGSRKSCISPLSHYFDGAKSSTLPSQVYSRGWHFRAILHMMCVTVLRMFSSTSKIRTRRKSHLFSASY